MPDTDVQPPPRRRRRPSASARARAASVPSWRVEPAPDGRGAPPPQRPPLMPRNRRGTFIGILVALLAVNFILALRHGQPRGAHARPVPAVLPRPGARRATSRRSPRPSRRSRATSRRRRPTRRRAARPKKVDKFKTEVPAFIDTADLTKLLDEKDVVVNAKAPDDGRSPLLDADPRLRPDDPARRALRLLCARRMSARRRPGRLRALAGAARRPRHAEPGDLRGRRRHRRGRERARRDRRLPQEPQALRAPRRAHPARRAALRAAGHGQDAARARRGRRGPRRRSSRSPPRSSSRRSSASAPRACATSSSRPRRRRRRSSSSTSSTPSGARARAAAASAAATTSASRRSTRSSPRWTASRPGPT